MILSRNSEVKSTEEFICDREIDMWSEDDAYENYARDWIIRVNGMMFADKIAIEDFLQITAKKNKQDLDDLKIELATKEIRQRAIASLSARIKQEMNITIQSANASINMKFAQKNLDMVTKSRAPHMVNIDRKKFTCISQD